MEDEEVMTEEQEEPKKKRTYKKKQNVITGKVDLTGFSGALGDIERDSMVSADQIANILVDTMEQAYLEWSYPGLFKDKDSTDPAKNLIKAEVVFDDKGFKIYDDKVVTEEDDIVDDAYQISLEDAKTYDKKAKIGDVIKIPFDVSKLDKVYVHRVKQLFQSHLKDASRQAVLSVYQNQLGELIDGTVTKVDQDSQTYEVSFGKANGLLRKRDIMPTDHFQTGDRVTVYLDSLDDHSNPPSLRINRSSENFVKKLFERNVLEIQTGVVKIRGIAREAGRRTKIFVSSDNKNIDPVGACIGPESSRINAVLMVIRPEKVDVIPYDDNKAMQVINAMTPAKIIGIDCPEDFFDANVHYDEIESERGYEFPKVAVVVQNGEQGVAIGSKGVNVRLASKLTKTSISCHTADEAIKIGLKYMLLNEVLTDVKNMEQERLKEEEGEKETVSDTVQAEVVTEESTAPVEPVEAKPAEDVKPVDETTIQSVEEPASEKKEEPNVEDTVKEEEIPQPVVEETKAVEEEKPVEEAPVKKEEEPIEHVEIKNKPKIDLKELEESLSKKKGPAETHSRKRYKSNQNGENKNEPSAASQQKAMPIYSEEELAQFDDQQSEDNGDQYDDYDDDFEEYDSDKYYDDDGK